MTRFVHRRATVAELHGLRPFDDGAPDATEVWWCDPSDAAVALGSRQRPEMLDLAACARAGLGVTRRRSGGGAVVVRPREVCWIDLVVPAGVAPDDVRGSMVWAGERWREALAPWLAGHDVSVHREGLLCTPWSDLVCFAGVGPGELLAGDAKLVGLSQRRNRDGLRIQGMVHVAPPSDDASRLWVVDHPTGEPPEPAALPALAEPGAIEHLAHRLADLIG